MKIAFTILTVLSTIGFLIGFPSLMEKAIGELTLFPFALTYLSLCFLLGIFLGLVLSNLWEEGKR